MSAQLTLDTLDTSKTLESFGQNSADAPLPASTGTTATTAGMAIAEVLHRSHLIFLDMGDTSCSVSLLIDGKPDMSAESTPADPLAVNIHSIRVGGRSTVRTQADGLGVDSSAAQVDSGPARYDQSGGEPTVTDAILALGQLDSTWFADGQLSFDRAQATAGITVLGQQFGLDTPTTAEAICDAARTKMINAIRALTQSRGVDLADFSLLIFGSAGPMHGVFVARELGIAEVIVPHNPVTFSAWETLHTELEKVQIYGISNLPPQLRPMIFDGEKRYSITAYRDDLPVGINFASPAVVVESATATIVPPAYNITVDDFGSLIITQKDPQNTP